MEEFSYNIEIDEKEYNVDVLFTGEKFYLEYNDEENYFCTCWWFSGDEMTRELVISLIEKDLQTRL